MTRTFHAPQSFVSLLSVRRVAAAMWLCASAVACGGGQSVVKNTQSELAVTLKDGVGKVPLTGCASLDYMAPFNVGGQTMHLLLDSGSTSFGVAGSSCSACTPKNGVQQTYTISSTGKATGHNSSSDYADGSGWKGSIVTDDIAAGTSQSLATPAVQVAFATIRSENDFFEQVSCVTADDTAFDGIAGTGPDGQLTAYTTSFLTALTASGKMAADMFSLQICDAGGSMWLGGYDATTMTAAPKFTPIVQSDNGPGYFVNPVKMSVGGTALAVTGSQLGPILVDSGTNALLLTKSAYKAFVQELQANKAYEDNFGDGFITATSAQCLPAAKGLTRAQVDAQLPTVTVTFPDASGGTFDLQMPATSSYLVAYADPSDSSKTIYYCPSVTSNSSDSLAIFGNVAMRGFITVFDRANNKIGFAPQTGCAQTSLYGSVGT